jgi:hypothetical protein
LRDPAVRHGGCAEALTGWWRAVAPTTCSSSQRKLGSSSYGIFLKVDSSIRWNDEQCQEGKPATPFSATGNAFRAQPGKS